MKKDLCKTKDLIIYNVFKKNINESIELLTEFASIYHIILKKKRQNIDLKEALLLFIKNDEGYKITIPRLYNALIN